MEYTTAEGQETPERGDKTELKFVYGLDSEIDRVNYTIGKKGFYDEFYPDRTRFILTLPEGSTMDGLSRDYEEVIERELEPEKAKEIEDSLKRDFEENYESIKRYFNSNGFEMPKSFYIKLTKYGTGGSYDLNPLGMTINISNPRKNYLNTLVHELTHTAIERKVLENGIQQHDKERIVDQLMIRDEKIHKITNRKPPFGPASDELLRRVGLKTQQEIDTEKELT